MTKANQSGIARQYILSWLIVLFVIIIALVSIVVTVHTTKKSVSLTNTPNCSSSAIIECGSNSTAALQSSYKKSSYAQKVFTYMSITDEDVNKLGTSAVVGSVNKNGDVYIAGNASPVATNALIASANTKNQSEVIQAKGIQFALDSPSAFMSSNTEPAYVIMKNTVFSYAIIASGDNPVSGTDITAFSNPSPAIASTKSTTTTTVPKSTDASASSASPTASSGTSSKTTTPATAPAAPTTTTAAPLTATGPSTIQTVGLFAVVSVIGTGLFRLRLVRRARAQQD